MGRCRCWLLSTCLCVGEGEKGSVRCFPLCCLLCLGHGPPAQSCPLQVHSLRGHQWGTGAAVTRASLRLAGRTRGTEFIAFRAFRKNCLGITGAFYPAECPLPAPTEGGGPATTLQAEQSVGTSTLRTRAQSTL